MYKNTKSDKKRTVFVMKVYNRYCSYIIYSSACLTLGKLANL